MQFPREEAVEFFSALYGGEHHIPQSGIKPFGEGWCVSHLGDLATFDANDLTHLVLLAHNRCVRASILPGGPRGVRICIHKREGRDGNLVHRHPTIEQALQDWKK